MDFLDHRKIEEDPVKSRNTELVERKGLGHPDSISDGIAESVSRTLSREYRDRFGRVLHHNTDEVQLVAGNSDPGWGEGEVISPMYILLAGRATKEFDGEKIPVDEIALDAAKEYISENFKKLEPRHVEFESRIGETSSDLKEIFSEELPKSNDTSFGVDHSPFSPTEKIVRNLEGKLHSEIPEVGEDVKLMGLRQSGVLKLTVAAAVIAEKVAGPKEYREVLDKIRDTARDFIRKKSALEPEIHVNTADEPSDDSYYITVTGTSAEMGDDGSVGRGNRTNGLITPHRSMSLEAASGKNPVTHVGKIYNLLAKEIADTVGGRDQFAEVKILSQIGAPLDKPQTVEIEASVDESRVEDVVEEKLSSVEEIRDRCVRGEYDTF
jgi:S-adenosylmethionine synthetase